jgi:hypothetical protein
MRKTIQYRVVWKREGLIPKRRPYKIKKAAERFMRILGPEPWKAFNQNPEDYYCCCGAECDCRGISVKQEYQDRSKIYPKIEFIRLESREVMEGEWK